MSHSGCGKLPTMVVERGATRMHRSVLRSLTLLSAERSGVNKLTASPLPRATVRAPCPCPHELSLSPGLPLIAIGLVLFALAPTAPTQLPPLRQIATLPNQVARGDSPTPTPPTAQPRPVTPGPTPSVAAPGVLQVALLHPAHLDNGTTETIALTLSSTDLTLATVSPAQRTLAMSPVSRGTPG